MLQEKKRLEQQKSASTRSSGVKLSPSKIRLENDLKELTSLPSNVELSFPDQDDKMHFIVTIRPLGGYYKGGVFQFDFKVEENYPIEPPKVKCIPKIYHPNIDLQGNVCLNVLREEWTPALDIYRIIMGLVVLFTDPNPMDPLNKDAANMLAKDSNLFSNLVRYSMKGGYVDNERFDRVT